MTFVEFPNNSSIDDDIDQFSRFPYISLFRLTEDTQRERLGASLTMMLMRLL